MVIEKVYDYYQYEGKDSYGQPMLSTEAKGTINMAIINTVKSVNDSADYLREEFLGLTWDKDIDDTYVIQYGDKRLKVLYVITAPRLKSQVIMTEMF